MDEESVYAESSVSPTIDIYFVKEKPQYGRGELVRIFVNVTNYERLQNITWTITDPMGNDVLERFTPGYNPPSFLDDKGVASAIFTVSENAKSGTYVVTTVFLIDNNEYSDSVSFYVNSTYPCSEGQKLVRGICINNKEACLMSNDPGDRECIYDERTGSCECVFFEREIFPLSQRIIVIVTSVIVVVVLIILLLVRPR
ncbi:MAG: hypothetical protein QXW37_06425 [Candidatus Nitrosotenuis sp.]